MLVGGPDVDSRLELMHALEETFALSALGSVPALRGKFLAEGFEYGSYNLDRGVNPLSDMRTFSELVQIFRSIKPEVVHTFDTKPGVWARLAARISGVPVVIGTLPGLGSLYTSYALRTQWIRLIYQELQRVACRFSDLTVFQNHDDARLFIKLGIVPRTKTRVIPGSGIRTDLLAPKRLSREERTRVERDLGLKSPQVRVTMISRVIRSKGVLEFMAAAQEIQARYAEVSFILVGPDDRESIDRLSPVELTELKQAVAWEGPRDDISTLLNVSDIFVFPTMYREGIPRVLLEAASMRLPIITTNSPGCKDVVEDGVNGYLVPVGDPKALTHAIVQLLEHPELRIHFGRVSRDRAVERFDLRAVADQTRSIYKQSLLYGVSSPQS